MIAPFSLINFVDRCSPLEMINSLTTSTLLVGGRGFSVVYNTRRSSIVFFNSALCIKFKLGSYVSKIERCAFGIVQFTKCFIKDFTVTHHLQLGEKLP